MATFRRTRSTARTRRAAERRDGRAVELSAVAPAHLADAGEPQPHGSELRALRHEPGVVPLKNGTQQRIAYDNGLNPLRNQFIRGPWAWTVNSSLFKMFPSPSE